MKNKEIINLIYQLKKTLETLPFAASDCGTEWLVAVYESGGFGVWHREWDYKDEQDDWVIPSVNFDHNGNIVRRPEILTDEQIALAEEYAKKWLEMG